MKQFLVWLFCAIVFSGTSEPRPRTFRSDGAERANRIQSSGGGGAGACPTCSTGLVAYYSFDTDGTDSTGNHNGSYSPGGFSFPAGKVGNALSCDTGDYVYIPGLAPEFGTSGTLAVWVKAASNLPANPTPWRLGTSNFADAYAFNGTGLLYVGVFTATRKDGITSLVTDRTQWHLVVITQEPGANGWKMYQNNALVTQVAGDSALAISSATPGQTGAPAWCGGLGTFWTGGLLDEAGLWSRVLTSDERAALYNGGAGLAKSAW